MRFNGPALNKLNIVDGKSDKTQVNFWKIFTKEDNINLELFVDL